MERREGEAVPLTIISGFLGAGKTTVINNLVRKREAGNKAKTGLLVNDFAEVNIDAELIRSNITGGKEGDADTLVELSNGCVCCTISGELQHSIEKVLACNVDHIIVETSGVSDPSSIITTLLLPQLRKHVWLSGLVVVVDGESIEATLEASASARNQLKQADVVVINKTDLLSNDEYETVKESIKKVAPEQFNVIPSQYGSIPDSVVYDLEASPAEGDGHAEDEVEKDPDQQDQHQSWMNLSFKPRKPSHKQEIESLATVSYSRKGATFDLARFQGFMASSFPPTAIRAKGFLCFDCAPGKRYILQLSGKRRFDASDLTCSDAESGSGRDAQFVFIGSGLDRAGIIRDLDSCRSGGAVASSGPEGSAQVAQDLCTFIKNDLRFEVVEASDFGIAIETIVLFRLRHTRWHSMSLSDMNRSLLSTFNSTSNETRVFLTHQTNPEGDPDSFTLRLDAAGCASCSAQDIWIALQRATESMLTNVFMSTFCCGIK
ncbi:P-loop-containing nucleoside triphosphate hydrolase [Chloropicon primus]|uniref:P-loop-containing nucleoside triphosphate hydrolase n=1 Tax=Chloropicon primus TaxID=1764295 RepID=A0A5B8MHM0_9CHLO|nr:P-loop-containing nucleoside triphosphate hydrolase [Chloropicon primus]UPQ99138.1 P-loop-containing nucleoside triphosphate hydrolase [Chloropicon primus]|eukprot:QDZ19927.1 P-loop-containing nucleoside triphosphate hydrolase [Chloropicon primus]